MLARLADLGIAAPRRVLAVAGLLLVLAGVFGSSAADHLSAGGFQDPGAASTRAQDLLQHDFQAGDTNLIIEVTSPAGVDDQTARAQGLAVVEGRRGIAVREPGRVLLDGGEDPGRLPAQPRRPVGSRGRADRR